VEVEGVVADSPRDSALLTRRRCLVGLAVDAQVHDVVTANGAVVDNDVPSPESDCIPLLDLELLLSLYHITARTGFGALHLGRRSGICHLDVGHIRVVCGVLLGSICGVQLEVARRGTLRDEVDVDLCRGDVMRLVRK